MKNITALIGDCLLFNGISADYLDQFTSEISVHSHKRGEAVYRVGDQIRGLYIIKQGRVRFDLDYIDGFAPTLIEIGVNSFFGDYELLLGKKTLVSALVTADAELVLISRKAFLQIFEQQPGCSRRLARIYAYNQRAHSKRMAQDVAFSTEQKIARYVYLQCLTGGGALDNNRLVLNITHEELATSVGCARVSISRPLKQWKESGWITIENRRLIIEDVNAIISIYLDDRAGNAMPGS